MESIEDVFDNGGKNALHGFIIGSMNGLNRGVYETKIRKAYNEKPYQQHHFATNKNKTYTPEMKRIAEKYNLDLDGDWNKELLPHMGKHPNYYHEWVIEPGYFEIMIGESADDIRLQDRISWDM